MGKTGGLDCDDDSYNIRHVLEELVVLNTNRLLVFVCLFMPETGSTL